MTDHSQTMMLHVRGWQECQQYRSRKPPWIKLHRELLDDIAWHSLPDASKALAPMIWLLASEKPQGLDVSIAGLAFRLRTTGQWVEAALAPLIAAGLLSVEQVAGNGEQACNAPEQACSAPEQVCPSESESETKGETEAQTEAGASPVRGSATEGTLTDIVFGQGLDWLARTSRRPEGPCRSFLGKVRGEVGDAALIAILENARRAGALEPFAYIRKAAAAHVATHDPPQRPRDWN